MKWNHLPLAGGMYDQHPDFVEKMQLILHEVAKQEESEAAKQKAEAEKQQRQAKRK